MKKILLSTAFLILFVLVANTQVRIKMQKENGVYTTPCIVNGLKMRFVFDTGASSVTLSLAEAMFMMKNGYLDKEDIHGLSYSQLANGEIVENTTVNLKEVEIGGIKIHNVEAKIIHELTAPLLLGQSVIQRLGKIQINDDELVILEHYNIDYPNIPNVKVERSEEIKELINKAKYYYFNKSYKLAIETYQKAYNLNPKNLDNSDLSFLGTSYFHIGNYSSAIKNLELAEENETDEELLSFIYSKLSSSYGRLLMYDEALLNAKKQLNIANDDYWISDAYFNLGFVNSIQAKYDESIPYYKKSVEMFLDYLSFSESDVLKDKVKNGVLGEIYYEMALPYAMLDMDEVSLRCIIKSALCGYEQGIDYCKRFNIDYKDTLNSSSKNTKTVYYKDISFQCPIHWEVEKQTIQDEIMYIVTCEDKEINTNSMASILCINVEVPAKETLLDTIERMKSIKRFKSVRHSKIKDISFSNMQSVATEIYGVENGEEIYGTSVSFNFKGKTVVIFVASDSKENHDTIYGIIESGFHMK